MSIFQNTIFQKYLKTLNQETINQKWEVFKEHFHNTEIQENIRNSKEEQYQGEFLIDLFVNVLGYTKNPTPKFNLTTEYKNVKDSKKADGAIIINDKVVGIIELKGTNTTDLSKIEDQAFGYKNNQPDCKYIITSNFEKIRFYIDNAIDHLEFNLFTLSEEDFKQLYLCLSFESLNSGIPKKIKDESLSQEDTITKKLYKDYSLFKRELFQNLTELNPEINQLELFKKSQKLIDRFLFLFFGEDRFLLPPNSVRLILSDWRDLLDRDEQIPLYDRFKKYFGYLNTGFEGKRYSVFAYNGGLFKPDEILDNITIDSELLYKHTFKLSEYDFGSEVDVNILGHIFENSLNEIDEIKAQLEGQEVDKSKTKRKKDGVFYTPKYITKYIVENTVGKLCEEKKAEIGILEEEYFTDKKRQQKTKLSLLQKLDDYRNWLHQITIIDPACGSGAFLNEALNFLISEHKYIDELEAKLTGSSIAFTYHSASILENNLFGVDLNEESVEIAKLSLWLRTAEPNRKLNDLSNNIKCGNSLIDDPEIAGSKAFNWEKGFPQVFAKGGFDVVIGNPPYVVSRNFNDSEKIYFEENYKSALYQINLYLIFIELGLKIARNKGYCSYIIPNTWLINQTLKDFRQYIIEDFNFQKIVDLTKVKVFEDATVLPIIFNIQKDVIENYKIEILKFENNEFLTKNFLSKSEIQNNSFFINYQSNSNYTNIINKINNNIVILDEISKISFGVKFYQVNKGVPKQTKEIVENKLFSHLSKINENCKMVLEGKDVDKYILNFGGNWIEYGIWLAEPRTKDLFEGERILVRRIVDGTFRATFINEDYCNNSLLHTIKIFDKSFDSKYILSIVNSKLLAFFFVNKFARDEIAFPEIRVSELKQLPIKKISSENQQPFIEKADQMLSLNKELQEISEKFQRSLQREFSLETISKKLQNWYELTFADFLKELVKAKVNLSLSQKAEWEDYFLAEQQKAVSVKSQIDQTDKEIDQMVYNLYGLTEEEIEIVEKG